MFAKLQGLSDFGGTPLHWGRADLDSAPYMGSSLPLLKQDEAESLLERAAILQYGTFDVSMPEQQHFDHTLQMVLERYGNRWYKIRQWLPRWGEKNRVPNLWIFVLWEVPVMQTAARSQYATNFIPINGSAAH